MPPQRLLASAPSEARSVGLLLLGDLTKSEVEILCLAAQHVWLNAFPGKTRIHKAIRSDKNMPYHWEVDGAGASSGSMTERKFLKRCHQAVLSMAPVGSAAKLETYKAEVWTEGHAKERSFQQAK